MIECHTHCEHSADSAAPIREMIEKAIELNVKYIAFTDHCDRDYLYNDSPDSHIKQIDLKNHINEVLQYQREYLGIIYVALGLELGYEAQAQADYKEILSDTNEWDIILNSVHTVCGIDCYRQAFFKDLNKREAYDKYLMQVLESVKASYSYDVITHFGYVTRRAPYDDNSLYYSEHSDIIDEILKAIIDRNVSLELNSRTRTADMTFIPSMDIVKRYVELGGREFTFGTDAHSILDLGKNYKETADFVKSIGIDYFNVYKKRKIEKIKI